MDPWIIQILTPLLAASGALAAGFFAWLSSRKKNDAEAQKIASDAAGIAKRVAIDAEKTVSDGFSMLVTKLQEERKQLIAVIDQQSEEITALRSEVRALSRNVVRLENVISKAGLDVPTQGNA